MKIHILGPSGSGTTSLGTELACRLGVPYYDSDDFFWEPTDPPFNVKRPGAERMRLLGEAIDAVPAWVVGGSAMGWGDRLLEASDLIVYLYVGPEIRIPRLIARERRRFGARIDPAGDMRANHIAFIDWAKGYESGGMNSRSRASETVWLTRARCPVLRLETGMAIAEEADRVMGNQGSLARKTVIEIQ